jgi:hypothetical protein
MIGGRRIMANSFKGQNIIVGKHESRSNFFMVQVSNAEFTIYALSKFFFNTDKLDTSGKGYRLR